MKLPPSLRLFIYVLMAFGAFVTLSQRATTQQSCTSPALGLVAWYPGDDNTNDIQNSYNGTLQGGAGFAPGKVGKALSFDGVSAYVQAPATALPAGSSDRTMEMWVKVNSFVSGEAFFAGYGNFGTNNQSYQLGTLGTTLFFSNWGVGLFGPQLQAGVWYHVAVTNTGSAVTLYLNGAPVAAASMTLNTPTSTQLNFGRIPGALGDGRKLNGLVDEPAIYNRALSLAEIQALFNADGAGKCKPAYVCTAPPANLTAWFTGDNVLADIQGSFSENKISEYFGSGLSGTFEPGKVGPAFSLNGSSSNGTVNNRSNTLYPGSGSFTVDAWIRTTQTTGAPRILSRSECGRSCPAGATSYYILSLNGGRLEGALRNSSNVSQVLTGATVIADGRFHHVAMSRDTTAGQFRLYVDGTLEASAALTVTGTIKDDDGENDQFVIGAQFDTGVFTLSGFFAGLIDELHYFNQSLSQTEIQSIFNAGGAGFCRPCAPPPTNLSLWLPFDETSGTNASDLTNHNNGATLRNGAAFSTGGQVGGALDLSAANGEVKVLPSGAGLDYQDWEQQTISFWLNWGGPRTTAQPGLTLTKRQYIWENTADGLNTNGFAAIVIDEPGAATGEGLKAIGQPAPGSFNTGGEVQAAVPLPSIGVWEHYTCIFDKRYNRISIYKSGEFASRRDDVWTPYTGTSTGAKYIGNAGPGNGSNTSDFHFRGKLDEFIVANTALSVAEIPLVDEVSLNIASAGASGVCRMAGNDNFAAAQMLNGSSGKVTGSNFKATKEAGETNHAGNVGIGSVWYRWQAPFSGAVNFSTVLSDFDTLLGIYTGSSVNALTPVAVNDDSASGNYFNTPEFTSSATFNAVMGTTYYIAVDGAQGRTGRISLGWGADVSISGQLSSPDQPFPLLLELSGDDHRAMPFFAINGTYNFQHLRAGGNYTVRFNFTRPIGGTIPCLSPSFLQSPIFLPLTGSVTNLNFAVLSGSDCGTGSSTVFGFVKRSNGVGIPGITVTLTSSTFNRSVLTDSIGTYTLTNIPIGINFTVAPESPNLIFTPASLACTSTDDIGGVDFTAGNTVAISGQSRDGSAPLSGTSISLSGTRALSLVTDANGYYSVEVPAGGNYTVTASRSGSMFAPPTRTFNNLTANQKSADFTTISTFTLTVASSNPDSGVSVTSSPNDNNGQGNGSTQFTRTYNASTVVSLTAPATASGKNFQKWLKDGADFAGNQVSNVNVTMDANHLLTAVYVSPPTIQFNAATYAVNEGALSGSITVTRAGDISSAASVDYATSEGSAKQNQDYVVTSGTLNFAANESSKTFNVLIVDDAVVEANEIINVTLTNAAGGALGSPSTATITISDNDTAGATSPTPKRFFGFLDGAQETPPNSAPATSAKGTGLVLLNGNETSALVGLQFQDLSSAELSAHIHNGAAGVAGPIVFTLAPPIVNPIVNKSISPTAQQVADLKAGLHYLNVHSNSFPNGEIRGQLRWSPTLEENFFVRQQYLDFLSRDGDPSGFGFWLNQVSSCQADAQCFHDRTISTSNAFFFEAEFQQTAGYVFRAYRAAFGNSQPFPNPDGTNATEANKLIDYSAFSADRARVVGGANLATAQLAFANQFVSRPAFTTKYAGATTAAQFVDGLLATIQSADAVNLTGQRQTLIDQYNGAGGGNAGRAMVLYRLADDNAQNPINNQAFITAEYNRQFALTLYFGYLRRNPDIGGFLFWQSQINLAPVRDVAKQNALVCSFITAAEYQLRFGLNAPRNNSECPQ